MDKPIVLNCQYDPCDQERSGKPDNGKDEKLKVPIVSVKITTWRVGKQRSSPEVEQNTRTNDGYR